MPAMAAAVTRRTQRVHLRWKRKERREGAMWKYLNESLTCNITRCESIPQMRRIEGWRFIGWPQTIQKNVQCPSSNVQRMTKSQIPIGHWELGLLCSLDIGHWAFAAGGVRVGVVAATARLTGKSRQLLEGLSKFYQKICRSSFLNYSSVAGVGLRARTCRRAVAGCAQGTHSGCFLRECL